MLFCADPSFLSAMAAQPPSMHTQLQIGHRTVSAQTHAIVFDPATPGAEQAAQTLALALQQLHPHADPFEPVTAAAYSNARARHAASDDPNVSVRIPLIVGRCDSLLLALGWNAAMSASSEERALAASLADWVVSTFDSAVSIELGSVRCLLFLGGGSSSADSSDSSPLLAARSLLASVLWFAKEILACNIHALLTPSSPPRAKRGNSPAPNAQLGVERLHVMHAFPAEMKAAFTAADTQNEALVAYVEELELQLTGENSLLAIDLHAPAAAAPSVVAPHAASPAPVSAPASAASSNVSISPPLSSPSPSPSPDAAASSLLDPSVLDPNYIPIPARHSALQPLPHSAIARGDKPMIAVDLDEVLGAFIPQLVEFYNATYATALDASAAASDPPGVASSASTTVSPPVVPALSASSFHSYHFASVWGGSDSEAQEKVAAFFASPWFADIPVLPGAQQTLQCLKSRFDFTVVTSRQHVIEPLTRRWLDEHFPGIFSGVFFGNHYGLANSGAVKGKAEMCVAVRAVCLIDDSVTYSKQCSHVLQRVLLFGEYAWNRTPAGETLPPNVVRCVDWEEVRRQLEDWTPKHQEQAAEPE